MLDFRLYAISDRRLVPDLSAFVKQAAATGLRAFQLREKDLTARETLSIAKNIRDASSDCKLFINDRTDIASAAGADGVHFPESSWPPNRLKRSFLNMMCGASAHSLASARRAEAEGADFVLFGPIYDTPSKQAVGMQAQGLHSLREITQSLSVPVFAVGGITPDRTKECMDAGAWGVAVIRDLMLAPNISVRLTEYQEALGSL